MGANDRGIAGVHRAVHIHVGAKVRRISRLTGATAGLRGIAGVDKAVSISVANQEAHS